MKGEKMIKRSSFGSRVKKRLSDITNLHSQHKTLLKDQENAIPAVDDGSSTKNYIEQILNENATMMKLIQEKDKIIESTGLELQKLKVNLQRTQLQNWHLAQSNSQMLAELNMAKDRLKNLQHELVCKEALFKTKTLELQEKANMQSETSGSQEGEAKPEKPAANQPVKANVENDNRVSKTKRGRTARSQSMGPTTSQQAVDKETAENKRRCLRRQSVRLKSQGPQAELFEIEVANTPVTRHPPEDAPRRSSNLDKEDDKECLPQSSKHSELPRSSIGRPQRRVTEKVQSYKDPPLNTKMRRPE